MHRMKRIDELRFTIELHRGCIIDAENANERRRPKRDLTKLYELYNGLIAEKQTELDALLAEEIA